MSKVQTISGSKWIRGFALVAVMLLTMWPAMAQAQTTASATNDAQVEANVIKVLNSSKFKNVQVAVSNGIVTLTGTVDLYAYKRQAYDKTHHKYKNIAIRNMIEVVGTEVSDAELQSKLAQKIAYDRVGYGTTMFNAIGVSVRNGVVTLSGHAYWPPDKDSAVGVAEYFPGVKDVIDNIEVDPVSPMDDRIRIAVARSVYGFPTLNKYAIDPAKPIRITVINGNVTLNGMVDSQADKDAAGIRANQVSGVFKVINDLQVAGQREEKK
ncbi:MAG: BON domain-containing protein [Acidobacteriaceae bacterium]